MIDLETIQTFIGVKLTHILAGGSGGLVKSLITRVGWQAACVQVAAGMLTSAYFTEPSYLFLVKREWLSDVPSSEGMVGFIVGLTAMLICEGILVYARGWAKNPVFPNGKS